MQIVLALLLAIPAVPQDDPDEAKKKKLGELMQKMSSLQLEMQKLLNELSGGNREKQMEILQEVAKKYAPMMALGMASSQKAANERNASTTLKTFVSAQYDFRANDRDGNRVNDFWAGDVSGLYRITLPGGDFKGQAIKLIERSAAAADARPLIPLDKAGKLPNAEGFDASGFVALGKPSPKAGYRFVVLKYYIDETGSKRAYNKGNGRANARFGIAAYPVEYGKTGNRTFIVNEGATVFAKDTEGKPPEMFPADLRKEGWQKVD